MPVETFNTYDTRDDLAAALSDQIADRLTLDNASGDFASVALSGGSTPKLMFDQLQSKLGATREMIYFALVDERYVAASDPRSNEHMIRTHLGLLEHPTTEFPIPLSRRFAGPGRRRKVSGKNCLKMKNYRLM